jgi:hypothetical protein
LSFIRYLRRGVIGVSKAVKAVGIGLAIVFTGGLAAAGLVLAGASYGAVAAAWSIGLHLGASVALSGISLALAGTPKLPRVIQDVEYSGTVESRRIVYGRMKMSGMNVIPPLVSGPNGEHLHQLIAIAGHPVNAFGSVYLTEVEVPQSDIGSITGSLNDGLVTTGDFADVVRIRCYDGTQSTSDYILRTSRPSDWTTDHIGNDVAYMAVSFKLDEKKYAKGKPALRVIVEGKRCYDPRLDTSPGANPTNASYIAYTTNPALCLADYLMDVNLGLGESASRIDWSLVVAAANICDEQVQTVGASIQNRYTCNVVLNATDRYEDNITILASAMMGHCFYSGGKWLVYAGAWQTPSFALTQDDILGNFEIVTAFPYQERYNAVRGRYVDASRNYQEVEFNPRVNSAYVTEDGETIWRDAFFPACNNEYEAQRNAIVALRMSRNKQLVQATFGMRAWGIRPFQTGTLTIPELGWNAQPVTCESWQFQPDGTITMTLRETAASVWNDPVEGEYGTADAIGVPIIETFKPFSVASLSVSGTAGGVFLSWPVNFSNPAGLAYNVYRSASASPFSGATLVSTVIGTSYTDIRYTTDVAYYWVTVQANDSDAESNPTPDGDGIAGAATSAAGGSDLAVSLSSSTINTTIQYAAGGTSAAVTGTPSGGTPSYTYQWTRLSGSADISANSPTAATTTFTATGLSTSPSSKNAYFELEVTDSNSPEGTATAQVWVYFYRNDGGNQ